MSSPPTPEVPRLGELLISAGALTRAQLEEALGQQSAWGDKLGRHLLSLGYVDETTLATTIAQQTGFPLVDLDIATLAPGATSLLPVNVAERYGMVPLTLRESPRALLVACLDPTDEVGLRAARTATGLALECWVATPSAVDRAIRRHYYGEAPSADPGRDPAFNVTRNSFARAPGGVVEGGLPDRVATLEREVEELKRHVSALLGSR